MTLKLFCCKFEKNQTFLPEYFGVFGEAGFTYAVFDVLKVETDLESSLNMKMLELF